MQMQLLSGYPEDVFAAIWYEPTAQDDRRGTLTTEQRDRLARKHDVRLLAKYARGSKPFTACDLMEESMLGVGQWRDFGRIAIITDEPWMRHAVQFFAPFFHGPTRVFGNAQAEEARRWIEGHDFH